MKEKYPNISSGPSFGSAGFGPGFGPAANGFQGLQGFDPLNSMDYDTSVRKRRDTVDLEDIRATRKDMQKKIKECVATLIIKSVTVMRFAYLMMTNRISPSQNLFSESSKKCLIDYLQINSIGRWKSFPRKLN